MHMPRIAVLTAFFILIAHSITVAGEFDGSKPVLCAVMEIQECLPNTPCKKVTPGDVDFTYFLNIDVKNQKITGTRIDGQSLDSKIRDSLSSDGHIFLQGVEHDKGWTLSISEKTGTMVLSVSGNDEGFTAFGRCTTK